MRKRLKVSDFEYDRTPGLQDEMQLLSKLIKIRQLCILHNLVIYSLGLFYALKLGNCIHCIYIF